MAKTCRDTKKKLKNRFQKEIFEMKADEKSQQRWRILTASDPCIVILNSLTGREPKYLVLVSDKSPVTVSNTVRSNTPFCKKKKAISGNGFFFWSLNIRSVLYVSVLWMVMIVEDSSLKSACFMNYY